MDIIKNELKPNTVSKSTTWILFIPWVICDTYTNLAPNISADIRINASPIKYSIKLLLKDSQNKTTIPKKANDKPNTLILFNLSFLL